MKNKHEEALALMTERFGKDTLLALATLDGYRPTVRTVDAYYQDGAFYVITYALSGKMRQIMTQPAVGVSGEWFSGHGIAENLGHVLLPQHAALMDTLRAAYAAWYDNGHTNESDPNTCLLRIRMTDGVLFHQGTRYEINFSEK
ncbi:MAG: pyridoxamine 5'-phosphate oxidase family protein [Oscillospiraceae bacterium]|jgi:general stress protein 26|nr:pyridoxamine 5'-phosphate oxidase family protein [Oscillospiraceae bacterium]